MGSDELSLHASSEIAPGRTLPSGVGSMSLAVLATIAVIFVIHWARSVLIPIALAMFLSYALMPAVNWLHRKAKVPTAAGAALVLIAVVSLLSVCVAALHDQTMDMLDLLPRAAQKLERAVRQNVLDQSGAMGKLKKAATEIEKAANSATAPTPGKPPAVTAPAPSVPKLTTYLWSGSVGLAVGLGQAVVVIALTFFLLIAGDTFKRKIVRMSGETLREKKVTVQILHEIDHQIQRYLLVQIVASGVYGVLVGLVLWGIGLENALFWGLMAGILHLIPYVGPTAIIISTAVVAYLQFPDVASVLLVLGSSLTITTLIGFGMVPWLTERTSRLNAVTVFIALLAWGWLWGIWGLLLGVPIVMGLQAICERVVRLQPIAELLGCDLIIAPQPQA